MGNFERSHPLVTLLTIGSALWGAMLTARPGLLLLLFCLGFLTSLRADARATGKLCLAVLLPLLLLTVLLNCLFSHHGVTRLFTLPWGSPVTLEAMAAGFMSGLRFITIVLWLSLWSRYLTGDKLTWLIGRLLPSFALVLVLSLRLVPLYFLQGRRIRTAQRAATPEPLPAGSGADGPAQSRRSRKRTERRRSWRLSTASFSALLSWSLEHAIDSADAMRARGYGSGRQSFYSRWHMDRPTILTLCSLGLTIAAWAAGTLLDPGTVSLNPAIVLPQINHWTILACAGCTLTCSLPLLTDLHGDLQWIAAQSIT